MKVIQVCDDRPWVKLGNELKDSKWYSTKELPQDSNKFLIVNSEIEITTKPGSNGDILTSVKLAGAVEEKKPEIKTPVINKEVKSEVKVKESVVETVKSITTGLSDIAVASICTAISLVSIQGMISPDNFKEVSEQIYNQFRSFK